MKTKHNPAMRAIRNAIAALIRYDRWKHRNPLAHARMQMANPISSNAAFWMLTLLLISASCSPKRTITSNTTTFSARTEKVDSSYQNRETKIEKQKVVTETQRTLLDIESLTDEWEIRHRTFDPTLPTDSASGLPPIVSETIIVRKRTGSKQAAATENIKAKTDSKIAEEVRQAGEYKKAVKEVEKVVERTKEKEEKPNWWITVGVYLLGIGGIAFVVVLVKAYGLDKIDETR